MRRAFVVIGALVTAVLVSRGPSAWACSCAAAQTKEHFKRATVVFVGTAMSVDEPAAVGGVFSGSDPVTVRLAVHEVYKGDIRESVDVSTAGDEAACGVPFLPNERYAVFAVDVDGALSTSLCWGTTDDTGVLAKAGLTEPIRRFGPGFERPGDIVVPEGRGRAVAVAAAAVLAAAAAAALFLLRRKASGGAASAGD